MYIIFPSRIFPSNSPCLSDPSLAIPAALRSRPGHMESVRLEPFAHLSSLSVNCTDECAACWLWFFCGDVAMMGHVGARWRASWHTMTYGDFFTIRGVASVIGSIWNTSRDGFHTLVMIPLVGSVLFSRSNCYVFQGREGTTDRLDPCLERYDIGNA